MSSINQIVSEIAHSVKQPNSIPVRNAIKLSIIHERNKLIRETYVNHNYTDKVLQQRIKISLIDVPDGDLYGSENLNIDTIKRSKYKIPRPVRLTNNLPFHSVHTSGAIYNITIPFVKEASSRYYNNLPGFCPNITYDYNNEYLYININGKNDFINLNSIIIESVFEYPHIIETETVEGKIINTNDNDEFLIPEDMIGSLKKLVLEKWNLESGLITNQVPTENVTK